MPIFWWVIGMYLSIVGVTTKNEIMLIVGIGILLDIKIDRLKNGNNF